MLVWQDKEGKIRLAYEAPTSLAKHHGVEAVEGVNAMTHGLRAIAGEATAAD